MKGSPNPIFANSCLAISTGCIPWRCGRWAETRIWRMMLRKRSS